MFELNFHDQMGLSQTEDRVADGGWRMADGGWKNEDDEMRMEKCGWKADGKMRMTKSR